MDPAQNPNQPTPEVGSGQTPPTPQIPTYVTQEVNPDEINPPETPVQTTDVQTQQLSQPSVLTPQTEVTQPPKSRFKTFLIFLLLLLLLLFAGGATVAYVLAYEKVKLDKYPEFQKRISYFVISLPFMPKTPKFLLAKSALAHQDVTKESFDISVAIDSVDLASSLGLNKLDIEAKGDLDYSDPKNVRLNLDTSITKDFNVEVKKPDKMLYFKINKLPQILLTALGLQSQEFDPLLNKWVSIDTTPLDTEARRSIEDKEVDPLSEEYVDENLQKYLDEEVLSKMVLESATDEGIEVYKITLTADSKLIDHLGQKFEDDAKKQSGAALYPNSNSSSKLSDMVKALHWEIYIDKDQYYTRKIIVTTEFEVDNTYGAESLFLGTSSTIPKKSKANLAFAAKFGNFGETIVVKAPETSMNSEEFLNIASVIVQKAYVELLDAGSATNSGELQIPQLPPGQ